MKQENEYFLILSELCHLIYLKSKNSAEDVSTRREEIIKDSIVKLKTDFITPIERGDIAALIFCLDNICTCLEELFFLTKSRHPPLSEIEKCCEVLYNFSLDFSNYKKSDMSEIKLTKLYESIKRGLRLCRVSGQIGARAKVYDLSREFFMEMKKALQLFTLVMIKN